MRQSPGQRDVNGRLCVSLKGECLPLLSLFWLIYGLGSVHHADEGGIPKMAEQENGRQLGQ